MTKKPPVAAGKKIESASAVSLAIRGQRFAAAAKSAGKKATLLVGDLNKDGRVDHEDAKIAAATVRRVGSKVAAGAGRLAKSAAKHDMVKDAAAGAAIGAAVGIPVPVVGPMAGAAVGAVAGVAKNLRSASKPRSEGTEEGTEKQAKPSKIKSAMGRLRKPR
jgi:hypothetical protein